MGLTGKAHPTAARGELKHGEEAMSCSQGVRAQAQKALCERDIPTWLPTIILVIFASQILSHPLQTFALYTGLLR